MVVIVGESPSLLFLGNGSPRKTCENGAWRKNKLESGTKQYARICSCQNLYFRMKTSDRFFLCWTNSRKPIPHKSQERNVSKTFSPLFLRRFGERRKKKRSPTLSLGKQKGENKRKRRRRRRKGDFPPLP